MSFKAIPFDTLKYLHPTSHPEPSIEEGRCILKTSPGTDWWHTLDRDSQDGVVWGKWVEVGDGLEVRVKACIKEIERVCPLSFRSGYGAVRLILVVVRLYHLPSLL
jgi:hypothetical protein